MEEGVGFVRERFAGTVVEVSVEAAEVVAVDIGVEVVSVELATEDVSVELAVEVVSILELDAEAVSVEDPVVDASVGLGVEVGVISDADTVASAAVVENEVSDTEELGDGCGPILNSLLI